ncbi:MAG: hypothetical protein AB7O47_13000 [Flavobacteriales bacterium]
MLLKRFIPLTILLLFFILSASSQTRTELTKTMYAYSFTGLESTVDMDKVTKEIEALKGVTICKSVLKPEAQVGQLIVIVEEYSRTSEGQEMFEITDLKKIITQNGLIPNELTIEPFSN